MKKERDRSIDMLKILLVIGMILGHCIQLIGKPIAITTVIATLINLVTFSGFLFCFGYSVSIAYLDKDKSIITKIIKNSIEILIVFYISGISYEIFVVKEFTLQKLMEIFALSHIPGYSEFLAGFFVLNIFTIIFFNQIKNWINNKKIVLIILIVTLLLTIIPYEYISINQIGLLIGTTQFACFPVIQYLGYYILGMYFQKNKINFNIKYFITSTIGTSMFIGYVLVFRELPLRFPPSFFWIIGGSGIIYIYYLVSIFLSNKLNKNNKLYFIGENTLYFLLGSNLILFCMSGILNVKFNFIVNALCSIIIIAICYAIIFICKSFTNMKD